jgi:hypothetical protein
MVATWKKWRVGKLERILSQAISVFFNSINFNRIAATGEPNFRRSLCLLTYATYGY